MKQCVLPLDGAKDDRDITAICWEAYLEAYCGYAHRQDSWAWIFVDGLRAKENKEPDDENSHYQMFGDAMARARFRGWYRPELKTVTFMDRRRECKETNDIPEQVYQAIRRRWNPERFLIL
jgi:hypothetical protein